MYNEIASKSFIFLFYLIVEIELGKNYTMQLLAIVTIA